MSWSTSFLYKFYESKAKTGLSRSIYVKAYGGWLKCRRGGANDVEKYWLAGMSADETTRIDSIYKHDLSNRRKNDD